MENFKEALSNFTQMMEERQYHHIRVKNPDDYDRIRTITLGSADKGIKATVGFGGKAKGSSDLVTFMFHRDKWKMPAAKKWVKDHKHEVLKTVSAHGKKKKAKKKSPKKPAKKA